MKKTRSKKWGWWIVAVGALVVGYLLLTGPEGLINLYRSYSELQASRRELTRYRETADSLETKRQRLESDTAFLEEIAREKLGMAGKTERVFKFINRSR